MSSWVIKMTSSSNPGSLDHPKFRKQSISKRAEAAADACARYVTESGGQIAKFIDGTCMAYWPGSVAADAVAGACPNVRVCWWVHCEGVVGFYVARSLCGRFVMGSAQLH